jgi:Xaa-Pro aminopeptidase
MSYENDPTSPYYIDNRARVRAVQASMKAEGLDLYLGSRPRTLSWILDAFCPWRSFLAIPASGDPVVFTFIVDSTRLADETWLPLDNVRAYAPMGGQDQISALSEYVQGELGLAGGRIGLETGMSVYTPEGNITKYEWDALAAALPGFELVNAHECVDQLQLIKDSGTIARFREASRMVDEGQKAARAALEDGGWKGMTETEIAGIGALAMRRAGSVSEWNFAGLNEISSGRRTALGACTPPTNRVFQAGEPLMLDFHSMFKLALGDYSHNYLIGPATKALRRHADNFVDLVDTVLKAYRAGRTPSDMASIMMDRAELLHCADYCYPGCEHGIGLFGDEWRIGAKNDGPFPYWTDPDHLYQSGELLICAMQYASPDEEVGFRYENPIVLSDKGCEWLSKFPLGIEEIA